MVLFPEPVEPISASVSPFFALKEIFLRPESLDLKGIL